ncbi:TIR domain-containing adapter molecule 1 [Trachemys scripta elegans]|uniref:TIR domain-containing adapter molecule 1 n=1 Tax=Trachemys scripta elegans TaxID=31138 RepID=UPI001555E7C7|nr:TIR domain-containing adapter molecule 1 [Trachemys scripta elegans]
MAEAGEVQPGFEGVFSILSRIPEERLVSLKHKLKHTRPCTNSCKLLQAMVLLTLGRESEARICLDALGDDEGALCIWRSKWGTAGSENPLTPQQEAGALLALARIYSLLVEENLCTHLARDNAYKAAIVAFRASEDPRRDNLSSILAEAQEKCTIDFSSTETGNEFKTLRSDPGHFPTASPAPVMRSPPVQIGSRSVLSGPQTLRSSGSPASFISHFEISQSPTMEFHTCSAHRNHVPQPSKLCGGAANCTVQPGGGRVSHGPRDAGRFSSSSAPPLQSQVRSHPSENPQAGSFVPPSLPVPETPLPHPSAVHCPVECTDPPTMGTAELQERVVQKPEQESLTELPSVCTPGPASGSIRMPVEDSCVLTEKAETASFSSSGDLPPPQAAAAPTPELDCGEKRFFSFVVLHASEDVAIACRVKEMLESMGVPDGATFCEEFFIPGQCQLTCFQDAIDNSAFTLLLLTQNFQSHFYMHQMNTALMDSLQRLPKYNSVIPFLPKENPSKCPIPTVLAGLVPLDENSPVFSKTVKNTFRLKRISEQKAMWSQLQHIQEQHRKQQQYQEHLQMLQQNLVGLNLGSQPGYPSQMPLPGLLPYPAGIQQLLQQLVSSLQLQTSSLPMFAPPAMYQPHPASQFMPTQSAPSPSQHFILPPSHQNTMQGSGGPQPLIIQNAQMVQIGDHNQMQVERTRVVAESSDEETSESH